MLAHTSVSEVRRGRVGRLLAGLLAGAALLAGLGVYAAAQAPPKKDPPKKQPPPPAEEAPRPPDLLPPGFDDPFRNLPPGFDPDEFRDMQAQMERARRQMRRAMEQAMRQAGRPGRWPAPPGFMNQAARPPEPRLGVRLQVPGATLVDQLDLPRDQGLVLEEVGPNSPAAKAGLKAHDILLELAGKPVPSRVEGLQSLLADIKPNQRVDAVILRKGRKETIKGLSLPESRAAEPADTDEGLPPFPGVRPRFGFFGGMGFVQPGFAGNGVATTTVRSNDRFTTRHQEGSLVLTIEGRVVVGKEQVTEIRVEDDGESHRYESVDKVPERYRDKVKKLLDRAGQGDFRMQFQVP